KIRETAHVLEGLEVGFRHPAESRLARVELLACRVIGRYGSAVFVAAGLVHLPAVLLERVRGPGRRSAACMFGRLPVVLGAPDDGHESQCGARRQASMFHRSTPVLSVESQDVP